MTSIETPADVQKEAGFSLLEVLVAFAVLAVSLGAFFTLFGQDRQAIVQATSYREAVVVAQNVMDGFVPTDSESAELIEGSTPGGYRWALSTQPFGADDDTENWMLSAKRVSVRVSWQQAGRERDVRFSTLRVVPKPL